MIVVLGILNKLYHGARDEEYEAYITARNLNAELETLTMMRQKAQRL